MKRDKLENSCKKYHPDMELRGSGNQDYGHNLAERITQKREIEDLEKRAETADKEEFIEKSNNLGLNPDDVFSGHKRKAEMLQDIGYKTLKVKGQNYKQGERGIPIQEALKSNPVRLGYAFKSTYYSSLNQIKKSS